MSTTDIREALHEVAAATVPPQPDEVAFRAAVRAERRRHLGGRAALAGLVAATVAGAAVAVAPLVDGADRAPVPAGAADPVTVSAPPAVVWFVTGRRLTAVDPRGVVHDVAGAEEVIGSTSEGAWVVDREGRVVWFAARQPAEGPMAGEWTFEAQPGPPGVDRSPVTGPVQSAALSGDGRFLAWQDLQGTVTSYDLKADAVRDTVHVPRNTALVDVGAAGVLVSEDGDLWLRGERDVAVPTRGDGYGLASSLAGRTVAVADRDGVTRVYDLSSGSAERTATVPGLATVAPEGDRLAVLARDEGDTATTVSVLEAGSTRPLRGLVGTPESVRWADVGADRAWLLVTAHRADGVVLHACDPGPATCEPVHAVDEARLAGQGH